MLQSPYYNVHFNYLMFMDHLIFTSSVYSIILTWFALQVTNKIIVNRPRDWYTIESTLFITEIAAGDYGSYKCQSTWADGTKSTPQDSQALVVISKSGCFLFNWPNFIYYYCFIYLMNCLLFQICWERLSDIYSDHGILAHF